MHMVSEDSKSPVLDTKPVDPDFKTLIAKEHRAYDYDDYQIICDVGQGISLPPGKTKYKVMMRIQRWLL